MASLEVGPIDLRSAAAVQRSREPFSELAGIMSSVELPATPRASSTALSALSDRVVAVLLEMRRESVEHGAATVAAADEYDGVELGIVQSLRA